jgi:hypothetical protein
VSRSAEASMKKAVDEIRSSADYASNGGEVGSKFSMYIICLCT